MIPLSVLLQLFFVSFFFFCDEYAFAQIECRNLSLSACKHTLFLNYHKDEGPTEELNTSIMYVNTSLYVSSLSNVDVSSMDFRAEIYLTQSWFDHRFKFYGYNSFDLHDVSTLNIWTPDIYFPNGNVIFQC